MPSLSDFVGPRVPPNELRRHWGRYALPIGMLSVAKLLILISIFLPYWRLTLHAPQYPHGLEVQVYLNHVTGDVQEVDELNHYIGMRPLREAAKFERAVSVAAVIALTLLIEGAMFVHTPWALAFAVPAILFPGFVIADLAWWLRNFGTHLDPHAPLAHAVKPFVPPIFGTGTVGQFSTVARPGTGLILAVTASFLILVAMWFHRRAFKPLVEQYRRERTAGAAPQAQAA